jgi:SOS response regulatory protein OraA/RecX
MAKKRRFRYPEELDRKKVMEKWREALQSAPSLISSIFEYEKLKVMTRHDLVARLRAKNVDFDDVDDVIHEAERKKLICMDYRMWSAYYWIPPEKREEEKYKTEELEKAVEDVFLENNAEWLLEEKLKEGLLNKGLSPEDIERAIYEAERDCVISSSFESGGVREFQLIPREDRERKLELGRLDRLYFKRWLYEKALADLL